MYVQLIEKLSVRTPPGQMKLKVMKEIAKEHQIDWDTTESETELLKLPEEPIVSLYLFVLSSYLLVSILTNLLYLNFLWCLFFTRKDRGHLPALPASL